MSNRRNKNKAISLILTLAILLTCFTDYHYLREAKAAVEYTTLYLVDDTPEKWLGNDNAVMELVDNTSGHDHYIMEKVNSTTWSCRVPASTFNVTFNRLSPDKSTQWNSWSAGGRHEHSTYHAITHEHGYWDGEEIREEIECFKEGDVIYLDFYEFDSWEISSALFYVNFTDASKADNNGQDITISSANKEKYSPIQLDEEVEEGVYKYIVTKEDEGAQSLRFWRGNSTKLWNCSVTLNYSDYKAGNNCVKVLGWNDTGYVCPYVPRHNPWEVNLDIQVEGNKKVNRKLSLNLNITGEANELISDKTSITIKKTGIMKIRIISFMMKVKPQIHTGSL